jgi:hypothetical protein
MSVSRVGSGAVVLFVSVLLAAGCAGSHPAKTAAPARQVRTASTVPAAQLHALAARYLAIAESANERLDHEVDGYEDNSRRNLSAAEADLRAQAATEHEFDRQLSRIPLPLPIAAMAQALIGANQIRIGLTRQQARSSSSLAQVRSFDHRHHAADAAVEAQVRAIRQALGLPPPKTS